MTSYNYLISEIETFILSHPSNPKFFAEFVEQMPNLATKDEKYPLVFVNPITSSSSLNVVTYTVDIYCLDKILDDRSNINLILSEMGMLLNDIFQYFLQTHPIIESVDGMTTTPLNNFDLDYVAGWQGTIQFIVPQICDNLL